MKLQIAEKERIFREMQEANAQREREYREEIRRMNERLSKKKSPQKSHKQVLKTSQPKKRKMLDLNDLKSLDLNSLLERRNPNKRMRYE